MSTLILFTDNASSLLASGILSTDTSVTVTAGQGALFPAPGANQICVATLEDTSGNIEIVWVTARTTDTFVITRAQEGTTALAFASGSRFELRVTAGILAALLQKNGGDTLSGTTVLSGILNMGSGGSLRGGEYAGGAVRGSPGETDNQILVPTAGGAPTIGASTILTTANVANNLPSGTALALTGMVVFWTGASNAIPAGWVICDGTHGTPDLRDKFIVGGGGALPTTGGANTGTTGATSLGSLTVGGYALLATDLPQHTHTFFMGGYGLFSGASGGTTIILNSGTAQTVFPAGSGIAGGVAGTQILGNAFGGSSPPAANAHAHPISGSTSHAHTYDLPPYSAVFAIMKS